VMLYIADLNLEAQQLKLFNIHHKACIYDFVIARIAGKIATTVSMLGAHTFNLNLLRGLGVW